MADQDQAAPVDTDYSGRPYHRPSVEETLAAGLPKDSPYDLLIELPDGRTAVDVGPDEYYLRTDDGWPDWDRPVYIEGLSSGSPKPGQEIIPLPKRASEE